MTNCSGCGHYLGDGAPQAYQCDQCPPMKCETCGGINDLKNGVDCVCVIRLDTMVFADVKAIFAADGTFNLGGLNG